MNLSKLNEAFTKIIKEDYREASISIELRCTDSDNDETLIELANKFDNLDDLETELKNREIDVELYVDIDEDSFVGDNIGELEEAIVNFYEEFYDFVNTELELDEYIVENETVIVGTLYIELGDSEEEYYDDEEDEYDD